LHEAIWTKKALEKFQRSNDKKFEVKKNKSDANLGHLDE
jgi:hypothetical protein